MKLQLFMMAIVMTIAATVSGEVYGSSNLLERPIICHTPQVAMAFKINNQNIAFIERSNPGDNLRSIASTEVHNVRTRLTQNGFTKTLQYNNKRHTIHIANSGEFNHFDDYIIIRNNEGHEITYPLDCEKF